MSRLVQLATWIDTLPRWKQQIARPLLVLIVLFGLYPKLHLVPPAIFGGLTGYKVYFAPFLSWGFIVTWAASPYWIIGILLIVTYPLIKLQYWAKK
jgi:hypothetical protein